MAIGLTDSVGSLGAFPSAIGTTQPALDNVAAIASLDPTGFHDGTRWWITTLRCYGMLRTTEDPPVAMERWSTATAGRILERLPYPEFTSNPWNTQSDWYVDDISGSDEFSGSDPSAALKTFSELRRRTWKYQPAQPTVVHIMSDMAEDLLLSIASSTAASFTLDGSGYSVALHSGTISTFTNRNSSTPEWSLLTDIGVADWTPYRGRRIRLTSGSNTGAVAGIMKENPGGLGNNVARVGPFASGTTATHTEVFPIATDQYVIENLIAVRSMSIEATDPDKTGVVGYDSIRIRSLYVASGQYQFLNIRDGTGSSQCVTIVGCELGPYALMGNPVIHSSIITNRNGQILSLGNLSPSRLSITVSMLYNVPGTIVECYMGSCVVNKCASQNVRIAVFGSAVMHVYDTGVFGSASAGIELDSGGRIILAGLVWGAENTIGVRINSNTTAVYITKPTILGGTGADCRIAGVDYVWGNVPVWDSVHACGIVARV